MNEEKLTVVMPVYNEEEIIVTVVKDWHDTLEALNINFEIRCYNDGSKDRTGEILLSLKKEYPNLVVINKGNSGHGPTILDGYHDAERSNWIFQVDSDNEILANQFSALWDLREDYDFILGRRSHASFPLSRRVVTFIAWLVVKTGFSSKILDVNSPFRLFRSKLVSPLIQLIPRDTFAPNVLITGLVSARKLRVKEIQIENGFRQTGTVSIKHWKLFKVAVRSFKESILFTVRHRNTV